MAQLTDIYRVTKMTNKLAKKEEKQQRAAQQWIYQAGGYPLATPMTSDVKRAFKKRYPWVGDRRLHLALAEAKERGYLKEVFQQVSTINVKVIQIQDKGWHLLDRSLFKILPKGLLREWADINNGFNTLVVSFIGGVVIGAVGVMVAIMKKN